MGTTTNNDSQAKLNTALATLRAGGEVYINKNSRARLIDGKIVVWNPDVISGFSLQSGNASLTKEKVAAAYKAGKIGFLTQSQLSDALNPTKPVVPKSQGSKQPKRKLKGSADDDKGKKTPAETIKVRKDPDPELSPGKRLKNPLGSLSSYNYQLSLYMITPDALEIFKETGYRDINSLGVMGVNGPDVGNNSISAGAYIVAQSGGVNLNSEQRVPSINFDYGIDNLQFEIAGPKESGVATANYSFTFQITEPYGFSFISNLKRAADAIKDYNSRLGKKRSAVAKKKAAAQQQRTRRRSRTSSTSAATSADKFVFKESIADVIARVKAEKAREQPKYRQNSKYQSDNDFLSPLRGLNPQRPKPKGGNGGGRASADSAYRQVVNDFDKQQARRSAAVKVQEIQQALRTPIRGHPKIQQDNYSYWV